MISAIILTKNEEKNIHDCLKSLEWVDEIVIIDDYSSDGTAREVREKTKIFQRKLENNFAQQRNFAVEKAKGDWILFVDADERVSEELKKEILKHIQDDNVSGFYIKRKDFWGGKFLNHGETGDIKLLRLAKKGSGKWVRPVHEVWKVNKEIGELDSPLLHYPHQTVAEFLADINRYSDLNAETFYKEGTRVSFWQIIVYPTLKFIKNYFWKMGFLDGTTGFVHACLMSLHSFLTRAKIWEFQHETN